MANAHALEEGGKLCWKGKRLVPVDNMSMLCNLTFPEVASPIRLTKLGLLCGELLIDRTTILRFGEKRVAPLMFFMNDGFQIGELTIEFDPFNVRCFGVMIQSDPIRPARMVMVPLGLADARENLLSAVCSIQAQVSSAKSSFNILWKRIAKPFADRVEFSEELVFLDAISMGHELVSDSMTGE